MKLWCYDDSQTWGRMLERAASERGIDARLFTDPRVPDNGFVFFHMHHHPKVRLLHKRYMAILAMNPDLVLVPNYRSSVLYDDKIEQAQQLSRWMPRTHLFHSAVTASRFVKSGPEYPFLSKASEGAASHNVRMVNDSEDARREIYDAFGQGIKCRYGTFQHGYVLWQDFIPGNDHDLRVIRVGRQTMVLRRDNRSEIVPMASGSGNIIPITRRNITPRIEKALHAANGFFVSENQQWCGIDMVADAEGKWYVLESTVSWTMHGYYECEFFGPDTKGRKGIEVWEVLLDEIENGAFG